MAASLQTRSTVCGQLQATHRYPIFILHSVAANSAVPRDNVWQDRGHFTTSHRVSSSALKLCRQQGKPSSFAASDPRQNDRNKQGVSSTSKRTSKRRARRLGFNRTILTISCLPFETQGKCCYREAYLESSRHNVANAARSRRRTPPVNTP